MMRQPLDDDANDRAVAVGMAGGGGGYSDGDGSGRVLLLRVDIFIVCNIVLSPSGKLHDYFLVNLSYVTVMMTAAR